MLIQSWAVVISSTASSSIVWRGSSSPWPCPAASGCLPYWATTRVTDLVTDQSIGRVCVPSSLLSPPGGVTVGFTGTHAPVHAVRLLSRWLIISLTPLWRDVLLFMLLRYSDPIIQLLKVSSALGVPSFLCHFTCNDWKKPSFLKLVKLSTMNRGKSFVA